MNPQLSVCLHSALTFLPCSPSSLGSFHPEGKKTKTKTFQLRSLPYLLAVNKGCKLNNEKNLLFRGGQRGERCYPDWRQPAIHRDLKLLMHDQEQRGHRHP